MRFYFVHFVCRWSSFKVLKYYIQFNSAIIFGYRLLDHCRINLASTLFNYFPFCKVYFVYQVFGTVNLLLSSQFHYFIKMEITNSIIYWSDHK